jgi:nicotinamide riboside kinase
MKPAFVIGIVGAESSGKTQLAAGLAARLATAGHDALAVPEYLREFCDARQRTPRREEQQPIAAEQTRRIAAAAERHGVVVADTTALMIAVYSEIVFRDTSLYAHAERDHRRCDLTLLTALDLPWQADGLQRDGAHVRAPVDALVRAALQRGGQPFVVVTGSGEARLQAAWRAVQRAMHLPLEDDDDAGGANWHSICERCGDADCERHLLPATAATAPGRPSC